ncbi:MAG: sn-glycerol-1-phosphate dehydrogenase [Anaerolineae bacterium]|nr:sn-glycerol-1-phosphate dehydrogenase [Anaerolineae bacterium]
MADIPLFLGEEAVASLVQYCAAHDLDHFLLVADGNTYPILGQKVEAALKDRGWDVRLAVFSEVNVIPNEEFIFQVLLQADDVKRTYLAVGSGALTDITRIVSHRTRCPFISVPTAPSVDGFTSPSAALVMRRIKTTVMAQPPVAVFADLPTLAAAPQAMIASGYGDILGKAIALADWQLARLLWNEPYSPEIASRVRASLDACIDATDEIGQGSPDGVRKLMFSLIDSGFCMLDYGNSRPAAGYEHYMSHFLEMKLLREDRPAVLHGAKVGMCSLLAAELYAQLRRIDRPTASARLEAAVQPDRAAEMQRIRQVFGSIAEDLFIEQAPFLDMTAADFDQLKQRILDHWEEIQVVASEVPEPEKLADLLSRAGGGTRPSDLGLSDEEVQQALIDAHFLRNRFTISKLGRILGLESLSTV